ncbi:hypothetical protein CDAR_292981 [Caerostris darwini]|uniref:Uncharacterized protein n=1 Tax=Caerostris darwini TaxID=1538125 RepID=A0AAV4TKX9_9ARAC|nr:hypothetical protein CDAR_292981 [Caerostris darwini]
MVRTSPILWHPRSPDVTPLDFCMREVILLGPEVQEDGVFHHCNLDIRRYLKNHISHEWIARASPILWHPRSPDVTPLDFCMREVILITLFTVKEYGTYHIYDRELSLLLSQCHWARFIASK